MLFVHEVTVPLVLENEVTRMQSSLYYLPSLYILSRPVALLMKVLFVA
jgi:hypothetical protein